MDLVSSILLPVLAGYTTPVAGPDPLAATASPTASSTSATTARPVGRGTTAAFLGEGAGSVPVA